MSQRRDMIEPAQLVGLEVVEARFWRSIRVPPYALAAPAWLPGAWWSHCVFVYSRRRRRGGRHRRP